MVAQPERGVLMAVQEMVYGFFIPSV
ncbi:MAG: hypothetical protein JG760_288, partial [Desulfomicrobiaceae bacterium]|nr:hypothetical protein [Desulfomicrobiaceae bacterium]